MSRPLFQARPARSGRQTICPRCGARPGQACTGKQGQQLAGIHFQRSGASRRAFRVAMALYAPLRARPDVKVRLQP